MNAPLALIGVAVLMQAGTSGFLSGRLDGAQSLLFSTTAFALATVVFTVVDRVRRGPGRAVLRAHGRLMVAANVLTAVTFIGFYLSLVYVPAALAVSIETAIGPLVIAIAAGRAARVGDHLVGWVLLGCSGALALRLSGDAAGAVPMGRLATGVGLALLAGLGAAGLALLSKRLGRLAVPPVTVTANRFHLTYLAALVLLALDPPAVADVRTRLPLLVLVGLIAVVVPLYLLQVGLQRADSLGAMTLITTMPGLTYLAQVAFGVPFDPWALALTVVITVIAVGYARRPRRADPQPAAVVPVSQGPGR
ncbi:EamA family transporter [Actinoplanes sp. NPDC026670]|uniref:EamA family transporter n=1 Tax=Actinoplanes sp. NPDC026670 TaxID=3154700 RepID=UPI0033D7A7C2